MSKLVIFSIVLVATLSLVDSAGQHGTNISVAVYYESLCPDSIKFFTTQLYTTYTSPLKRYFQLKLIPYGKSTHRKTSEENWEFECHHGPKECYGNKVQACILEHIPQESQVSYINCLMSLALTNKNGPYPVDQCAASNKLDAMPVTTCANGTQGSTLLSKLGDLTSNLEPRLTSVPTIVVNDNFNTADQSLSQTNFKAMLCAYIQHDLPHECHNLNAASSSVASVAVLVPLALSVLLS